MYDRLICELIRTKGQIVGALMAAGLFDGSGEVNEVRQELAEFRTIFLEQDLRIPEVFADCERYLSMLALMVGGSQKAYVN